MRLGRNIRDHHKEAITSKADHNINNKVMVVGMDSKQGIIGMIAGWGVGVGVWRLCWGFLLRVVVWMLVYFSRWLDTQVEEVLDRGELDTQHDYTQKWIGRGEGRREMGKELYHTKAGVRTAGWTCHDSG